MTLSDYLMLLGGGSEKGMGGLLGLKNLPITDNVTANIGANAYYVPQMNQAGISGYNAAINAGWGKDNAHNLNIGAEELLGVDPRYFVKYRYQW